MRLIHADFKKGTVKIQIDHPEDLWYLSHLIDPGDLLTGRTARKVKISDNENTPAVKKIFILTIEAESTTLEDNVLRVNGLAQEGPEYIPAGAHHTLELEVGTEFTWQKTTWLEYQKQKLQEATQQKYAYLLCLCDREQALFALTKKSGYEILLHLKGDVPKKVPTIIGKQDFQAEVIKALETYANRYHPERIILASPAFYKEDLLKRITSPQLRATISLATCSDVAEPYLDEVMKDPELRTILKDSRARAEKLLVDELLLEINKNNLAAYGWQEVGKAQHAGAVSKLLLTDKFITISRQEERFAEVDHLMKHIDTLKGEIHIIASENDSGRILDGLGGIAALLRFKLWNSS